MKVRNWIIALLSIATASAAILSIICLKSVDCTKEYSVYREVENYSKVDEVREYLKDNKIEYEIAKNKITLSKYQSISFDVTANENCKICKSSLMDGLKVIDEKDYNVVKVTGKIADKSGKIVEKIHYQTLFVKVSKIDDIYYTPSNYYLGKLFGVLAIALAITTIILTVKGIIKRKAPSVGSDIDC